jgi:hypothetical protein
VEKEIRARAFSRLFLAESGALYAEVKTILRILALVLVLGAGGFWLATGANRGWTKNQVEKKTVDDVTGIEGVTYEKKFVPGVDFLGASAAAALVLFGVSFLFRNKHQSQTSHQTQHT